jgi:4-amino-4-deoxy-L-arabinose transferase-like glycosyltransferase
MAKSARRRRRRTAEPHATDPQRWGWQVSAVFVAALALRLLYLLSIHRAYFFAHLQTEPLRYHEWATLILDGRHRPQPPFEQAPGYAYFIAAIYAVCGRTPAAVAVTQAFLDAVSCALVSVIGRRWFGARMGLAAGVLAAVYGPLIYFTGELVPSTLFVCIVMAALAAALAPPFWRRRMPQRPGNGEPAWTLAGSLCAVAVLVRSEIVLAFPFVLYHAWHRAGRRAVWRISVPIVGCLAACLAVNAAFSHRVVLFTTSGGFNLWLGNNAYTDGVTPFMSGPLDAIATSVQTAARDPVEADGEFTARAFEFWRRQPGDALRLMWKKLLWTWTDRELPNTGDIDWETAQSWLFLTPVFPLRFGMILPFAFAGTLAVRRRWRELVLLGGPIAVGVGTSLLFFTNARFRLIMVPALLLLAAAGGEWIVTAVQRRDRRTLALAAAACTVGAATAWGDFYGVRTYRIPQLDVNTGILEREAGNFPAAVRYLHAGLSAEPHDEIGWVHLALALEQQGDVRAALQAYLDALAFVPADASVRQMASRFFDRQRLDRGVLDRYISAADAPERAALAAEAERGLRTAAERRTIP